VSSSLLWILVPPLLWTPFCIAPLQVCPSYFSSKSTAQWTDRTHHDRLHEGGSSIRVSTDTQADGGVSRDVQQARLPADAQLSVLELSAVLVEAGGRATTLKRPGFQWTLGLWRQRSVWGSARPKRHSTTWGAVPRSGSRVLGCLRAARRITAPASQGLLLLRRGPIARQMRKRLRVPLQKLDATAVATAMDDEGAQFAWPPGR
jgi:hypothetical protein